MLRFAVVLLSLALLAAERADAHTPRKVCRQACAPAIAVCASSGIRPRVCRRHLVRACHRRDVSACAVTPATTTTTTPGVTTTTLPGSRVVNGCDPALATDLRNQHEVTIHFGQGLDLFDYAPECIVVSPGTEVVFEGNFDFHPLVGGEVVDGSQQPDPQSPFGRTDGGTSRSFRLDTPGVYPYYCQNHGNLQFKMWGAVIVAGS